MMSQDNYEDFKTEFQNLEFCEIKLWYSAAGLIETATAKLQQALQKVLILDGIKENSPRHRRDRPTRNSTPRAGPNEPMNTAGQGSVLTRVTSISMQQFNRNSRTHVFFWLESNDSPDTSILSAPPTRSTCHYRKTF